MAKFENNANVHDGAAVTNWISQINAGGTTYDIATHHSIKFVEGGEETTWNGLTDLTVVIPTIQDIVQTPIEFAGTVGADGVVAWNATHTDGPKTGYLVFVTADCTFGDLACEAGDMAIYDGAKWNIVSGENQVKIVAGTAEGVTENNRTTIAVGAAKDVLVVEGKALALTLDYADINAHLTTGDVEDVKFTNATVGDAYVKLTYEGDQAPMTIGTDINLDKASALKDGTVDLKNAKGLVNSVTFGEFNAGKLPVYNPNSEGKFTVNGGDLSLSSGLATGGHFIDSVSMDAVTFETAGDGDANKIKMVTGIVAGDGKEFLKGIHITGEDETADFTIAGFVKPTKDNVQFVEGLEGGLTPVTSITDGNFELVLGSDLATGFGDAATGKGGEVLSNVTVTPVKNANVLSTATVTDHVLSFGNVDVMSDVTVAYESRSLNKTGFKYTAPQATKTAFVTSGFTKVADVDYTFGRDKETTYTTTEAMWKLNTPSLKVTQGMYSFNDSGMVATIPSSTFIASVTPGELPSLTDGKVGTTDVTGTVGTKLSYETVTVHTLKEEINTITLPGAYTLGSADAAGDNTVLVGKAGELASIVATVDLEKYVVGVE